MKKIVLLLIFLTSAAYSQLVNVQLKNNVYQDETVIRFIQGATDNFDSNFDAYKLFSINQNVPSISSVIDTGVDLSINSYPQLDGVKNVLIRTKTGTTGWHKLKVNYFMGNWDSIDFFVTDMVTGVVFNMKDSMEYNFYLQDTTQSPQFIFHFSKKNINYNYSHPACYGFSDGKILFQSSNGLSYDLVLNCNNQTIQTVNHSTNQSFNSLPAGLYFLSYKLSAYPNNWDTVIIQLSNPQPLNSEFSMSDTMTCINGNNIILTPHLYGGQFIGTGIVNNSYFSPLNLPAGKYEIKYKIEQGQCVDSSIKEVEVHDCNVAGIRLFEKTSIEWYVSDGQLYLQASKPFEKLEIYDLSGKLLMHYTHLRKSQIAVNLPVNQSCLLLRLEIDNQQHIVKLIP